MEKIKILNLEPFADEVFLDKGYEVVHAKDNSPEALFEAAKGCTGILTRTEKISRDIMEANPELKIIARYGIGFDNVDVEAATELGIWVSNVPAANLETVAEGAIYLILALGRKFNILEDHFKKGEWAYRNVLKGSEVNGKVLGLVGLGKIGRLVAEKALYGLGMKEQYFDTYIEQDKAPKGVKKVDDWDTILRTSDFVAVQMPYFGKTLFTEHEFSLMKNSAYFINLSRGLIADEDALIKAIESGKIAGAGLDVYKEEPPKVDNPLLHMENVIALPHATGISNECFIKCCDCSTENIISVIETGEPVTPVNKPVKPRSLNKK